MIPGIQELTTGRCLDLSPIKVLHRHNGYISFAAKSDDIFCPRFAIRADALDSIFPEFRKPLFKESFLSINAAYCLERGNRTALIGRPRHRTDTLRYLCACYCDIDYYNRGLEFNQVFSTVMDLCRDGILPWASFIVDSGHGMWALWLLHDPQDSGKAHLGAFADNPFDHLQLYVKINRAIGERLAHLGADPVATDASRYIRVPGSLHMESENEVRWWIQGKGEGFYSYTLSELAEFFSIRMTRRLPTEELVLIQNLERKPKGAGTKGYAKAMQNKLAAFNVIMSLRGGGFQQGHRNWAAWIYAMLLRQNGVKRHDVQLRVRQMASDCTPRLSDAECQSAMKTGFNPKMWKLSYGRLASILQVTPHEAEIITQALGKPFPPSSAHFDWVPTTTLQGRRRRTQERQARRREISAIVGARSEPGITARDAGIALGARIRDEPCNYQVRLSSSRTPSSCGITPRHRARIAL